MGTAGVDTTGVGKAGGTEPVKGAARNVAAAEAETEGAGTAGFTEAATEVVGNAEVAAVFAGRKPKLLTRQIKG